MSAQTEWAEQLDLMEKRCPWPGPRPIRGGEALLGRASDLESFVQVVSESRLVILDGKSGVGKSSLLVAGLIPRMAAHGYTVAYSLDWQDDRSSSALQFLARKVLRALRNALLADDPLTAELAAELADPDLADHPEDVYLVLEDFKDKIRPVIVLDQFEELIRYSELRAREVLDEIAALNKSDEFSIVISLRSEYLHELRRLEKGVRSFGYATYELEPVKSTEIAKVILMSEEEASSPAIEDEAVERLCELWSGLAAETGPAIAELDAVGLLHLQALLHNLFWTRAADRTDQKVTLDDVEGAVAENTESNVFTQAIQDAVELKLNRCSTLAERLMDDHLRHGLRGVIARSVPHLSSAGYKLHREAAELAAQAFAKEFDVLIGRREVDDWHPMVRAMLREAADAGLLGSGGSSAGTEEEVEGNEPLDLFTASWFEIVAEMQSVEQAQFLLESGKRLSPIKVDSCGPMAWLAHDAVVVEELRRFAVAMMWLAQCSLIRITSPSDDRTMVSLVHDRFGEGLRKWADRVRAEPAAALHAITAPRGAQFIWREGDAELGDVIPEGPTATSGMPRVLANLRWGSSFIRADFKHVVFANCDFRGAFFRGCTLQGVTFLNCLLDGTMFDECYVVGRPPEHRVSSSPKPSSFVLDPETAEVAKLEKAILRYQCAEDPGPGWSDDALSSWLPGFPLLPTSLLPDGLAETEPTDWVPATGGLVLYGGRVSSLVMRNMKFHGVDPHAPDASQVSLRHTAGSGLDIVNQEHAANYEFYGSALRHVVITGPADGGDHQQELRLTVQSSALSQTWLGETVRGVGEINDSMVSQLFNAGEAFDLTIDEPSAYLGIVGAEVTPGPGALVEGDLVLEAADIPELVLLRSKTMNYTADPTAWAEHGLPELSDGDE